MATFNYGLNAVSTVASGGVGHIIDTSGAYSAGTILSIREAGAEIGKVSHDQRLQWNDGAVGTPAYSFINDPDCGFYRIGNNNIGMAINGIKIIDMSATLVALSSSVNMRVGDGAVGLPGLAFASDAQSGLYRIAANNIGFSINGAKVSEWAAARVAHAVNTFIGDDANANMTLGLTINQGAADDELFAGKSSDVDHGMTDVCETDTYVEILKALAASGGVALRGFSEATIGVQLGGNAGTVDTTKSTAGVGAVVIQGALKSGATTGSLGADANIAVFRDLGTTRFILDSDGDSHQDVGTAWTNFDTHDDVALLNLLSAHVTRQDDPLREAFGGWLEQNRDELERTRLVSFNDDGHHFVNMSRLAMLHTGAIRQLGKRTDQLADVLHDILQSNPTLHGADKALALLEA